MEDVNDEHNGKKRARDDSGLDSPDEKRVGDKRLRKDSDEFNRVPSDESGLNSPELNRIPNDILDILDESDSVTDCDPAIQDLDSVIKSFEEEILHPSPAAAPIVWSDSGESQLDLGYLLEASDDELGLPPTVSPSDEQTKTKIESVDLATVTPEDVGLSEGLGFENEFPSYDSFGIGIGDENQFSNGEYVTVGGLFDYDSADFSEILYAR